MGTVESNGTKVGDGTSTTKVVEQREPPERTGDQHRENKPVVDQTANIDSNNGNPPIVIR